MRWRTAFVMASITLSRISCAFQHLAALFVDDFALVVHHVVIFQHVLADFEVMAFHLLLRIFDVSGDDLRLDRLAFFPTAIDEVEAFRAEEAHQFVLHGHVETRLPGIALAAGTPAQLVVDTAAFMPFRADDRQPAAGDDEFAVGIAAPARFLQRLPPLFVAWLRPG